MILNQTYYYKLKNQYQDFTTLSSDFEELAAKLSLQMIMKNYYQGQPIHINFQNRLGTITEIGINLFIELANDIYINYPDLPNYELGDKLERRSDKKYYEIIKKEGNSYSLLEQLRKNQKHDPARLTNVSYESLCRKFVKIQTGVRDSTIKNYINFFKDINNQQNKEEFLKTYFEQKCVFIARKSFWDKLGVKTRIPSIYIPNPREENDNNEIRTIPALPDCIIYVTPKYEQCYQQILQQNNKVKTIVFLDTEEDKIQQVLQDKNRFGFNIIVLSNRPNPIRFNQIPCWNWFNEEIEIVNAL